jgi:hypothetical protein
MVLLFLPLIEEEKTKEEAVVKKISRRSWCRLRGGCWLAGGRWLRASLTLQVSQMLEKLVGTNYS